MQASLMDNDVILEELWACHIHLTWMCPTLSEQHRAALVGRTTVSQGKTNNVTDIGAGAGTSEYYMVAGRGDGRGNNDGRSGSESSVAKAKVFFELWDEDKGTPLGS